MWHGKIQFLLGAVHPDQYPQEERPEIAFAGRSNVGKSSLLNRVLGKQALARVSRTPGCTRQIQYFDVNGQYYFVDLPGYGYAQAPLSERKSWEGRMDAYFSSGRLLRAVIVLIDLRREMTDLDYHLIRYLESKTLPCLPVATKMDKLRSNPKRLAIKRLGEQIEQSARFAICPPIAISSLTGEGISLLQEKLLTILA